MLLTILLVERDFLEHVRWIVQNVGEIAVSIGKECRRIRLQYAYEEKANVMRCECDARTALWRLIAGF